MKQFRMNVFNVIIDSASSAARNRFGQNKNILQDIAFLDPQNFSLCREGIPMIQSVTHMRQTKKSLVSEMFALCAFASSQI